MEQHDITFNDARHGLLQTLAAEEETTLQGMEREYRLNAEFRRRIDIAALNMSRPMSEAIH